MAYYSARAPVTACLFTAAVVAIVLFLVAGALIHPSEAVKSKPDRY